MRWKLEELAKKKEKKGKQVGYDKIRIGEQWWRWDEVGKVLRVAR